MDEFVERSHYIITRSLVVIFGVLVLFFISVALAFDLYYNLFIGQKSIINIPIHFSKLQIMLFCLLVPFGMIIAISMLYQICLSWVAVARGLKLESIFPNIRFNNKIFSIHRLFVPWDEVLKVDLIENIVNRYLVIREKNGVEIIIYFLVDIDAVRTTLRIMNNHLPLEKFNTTATKFIKSESLKEKLLLNIKK